MLQPAEAEEPTGLHSDLELLPNCGLEQTKSCAAILHSAGVTVAISE